MSRVQGEEEKEKLKPGDDRTGRERWKRADHLMIEKKSASRSYFVERRGSCNTLFVRPWTSFFLSHLSSLSTELGHDSFHTRPSFPPSFLLITRPVFHPEISSRPFPPFIPPFSCLFFLSLLFSSSFSLPQAKMHRYRRGGGLMLSVSASCSLILASREFVEHPMKYSNRPCSPRCAVLWAILVYLFARTCLAEIR